MKTERWAPMGSHPTKWIDPSEIERNRESEGETDRQMERDRDRQRQRQIHTLNVVSDIHVDVTIVDSKN